MKKNDRSGCCNRQKGKRNAYNILFANPEGEKSLGGPRRGKNSVFDAYQRTLDYIHLIQNRDQWRPLVSMVTSLRIP
jgi:hypothetical protein